MAFLAHLALTALLLPAPQGDGNEESQYSSVLSKSEHKRLNTLAKKWFKAEKSYDDATGRKRTSARKSLNSAKLSFMKEWDKKAKKEPLKHVGDLQKIFENVFEYPRQRAYGEIKKGTSDRMKIKYGLMAPKGYKADESYRTMIVVPARDGDEYVDVKEHFDRTWKGTKLEDDTIFLMPEVDDGIALDDMPDTSSEASMQIENQRIFTLLDPAGDRQRAYRFDRNRLLLDADKGSCRFALRMATYFPARFAGLILRHPVAPPEDFRLGSMTGLPVLLVKSEATAADCDKIKAALDKQQPGSCLVVEAGADANSKIADWAANVERNLFRKKLVIEPTDDRFRRAYWAEILVCEAIEGVAKDQRPRLVLEADRDANRITVNAVGVTSFKVLLNDALLDLDKEFSLVVNGKAINQTRQRSLHDVVKLIKDKFDTSYLFPVSYTTTVPKAEGAPGEGNGGAAKSSK